MAFIFLKSAEGRGYVVQPSQIRRVISNTGCTIYFTGDNANTPITMKESITEVYHKYLAKTHILIEDIRGAFVAVKPTSIRRVHKLMGDKHCTVAFSGAGNIPIKVRGEVEDFFKIYLEK